MMNYVDEIKYKKWMRFCIAGAEIFSTCAKRQYFAFMLDAEGNQIGSGWNGVPKKMAHCADGGCPRLLEDSPSRSNYDNCYSVHAEQNALLHSDYVARRNGIMLIVNGVPCLSCAKLMVNGGVKVLVYLYESGIENYDQIINFLYDAGVDTRCIFREDYELRSYNP